ncbi:lytic murein transglycosylase [Nocardia sp. NPDC048505]|uniref:lytic transglycosylase domain-containing protein n=1 Tax=unclassified Nocardia TaxID=2637762 RepID=UPI0033D5D8BE
MGRHRKQSPATVRRSSVLALTGLVPAGFMAVGAASDLDTNEVAAIQQMSEGELDPLAAKPAVIDPAEQTHAMAKQGQRTPPVVKTLALPADRAKSTMPVQNGIPGVAVAAYQNAEHILDAENPTCNMPWTMLAGIGRVESTHAFGGKADQEGNALSPVYGPVLDGSLYGNNVIHDSDGGELDGLGGYDRAIGPMQFLPETWKKFAADGNNDGIADPQNLYDAALTAGKYLCSGGLNMQNTGQQTRAILRYNNSMAYVANVMAWANSYNTGVQPRPAELPKI